MLGIAGLALIVIAWYIQAKSVTKTKTLLNKNFVAVYLAGVILLILDGFANGALLTAILNLIVAIVAGWVLLKVRT